MPAIMRVRVRWAGSPLVGPGVSTFYFNSAASSANGAALADLFTALAPVVPGGVQWTIDNSGDTINEVNGDIDGSWSYTPAEAPIASSGSTTFTNGVGLRIKWVTDGIFHGDRVVGSTFVVPIPSVLFEGAGNLTSGAITGVQSAAAAFIAAADGFVIWSRPGVLNDGEVNPVTAASVPDAVSWLRSRRT